MAEKGGPNAKKDTSSSSKRMRRLRRHRQVAKKPSSVMLFFAAAISFQLVIFHQWARPQLMLPPYDDGAASSPLMNSTKTKKNITATTTRTAIPATETEAAATCRVDPELLRGYSPEEVSKFFSRPRPLLDCPARYRPYTSLIAVAENISTAATMLVLDERRMKKEPQDYVYAFYTTALEGEPIHPDTDTKPAKGRPKKQSVIQWHAFPSSTTTSSSIKNATSLAGNVVDNGKKDSLLLPVGDQDEIIFVKEKASSGWLSTRVHLRAAFRPEVAEQQAQKREEWLESHQPQLLDSRNVSIIHLDYDSVSRAHFRRMMPQTTALLDGLITKDIDDGDSTLHEVFDFQLHNVMGDNTGPNLLPFLYGWDTNSKAPSTNTDSKGTKSNDRKGGMMNLFEAAKQAGFVTAYVQDDAVSGLSLAPNARNPAHHTPNQAWTYLKTAIRYDDLSQDTRCIGDRPSSQVALEYVHSFLDVYQNQSTYAFAHLADAHETTGTVIQSADAPLANFLTSVLESSSSQDTILIISGDHGMRYGGWRRSMKGFLEHKLPPLYMLVPQKITKIAPDAFAALRTNTGLINSKLDLHATTKDLLSWPSPFPDNGVPSNRSQSSIEAQTLLQPLPLNRTCAQAGIPEEFCSCTPWQRWQPSLQPGSNVSSTIGNPSPEQIVEIFLRGITGMLKAPTKKKIKAQAAVMDPCSRNLIVHSIDYDGILTQEIQPSNFSEWGPLGKETLQRNFKVSFTTAVGEDLAAAAALATNSSDNAGGDEFSKAKAKATTTLWEAILNIRLNAPPDLEVPIEQGFPPLKGTTFPNEIYTIRSIERPSEWPSKCRNRAVALSIDPKFCVCPQNVIAG